MQNLLSSEKKYFGPLSNSPVLLLCSPGQALLTLFLVQKWLDLGNAAPVAHFLHTPVHGGSRCFYSRLSPLLPQVPQSLESVLLHNLPQGPVTSSRCAAFSAPHFFLPTDIPLRCLDTALWEQPIRSEISFCVLPSCLRVSMMAFWTAVRSAVLPMIAVLSNEPGWEFLKASGIFCRCLELIS
ncbi:Bifunctional glutamine synthetase adenylyltransferase/adenylyl-removing enzyme [Labeo rohita]|uniref:Bifunctional glutamine synthetase adenylyltransferase/adenylyl-removing enzyme n=1 Tax=Labeo rohita TaxID=84645 RepID=A0ABQ8MUK1_LABRO|nr:Bifunctional glutamine synthetase adenylyltransferase/adenylyl-removing enzyme [Labeo rohita]